MMIKPDENPYGLLNKEILKKINKMESDLQ
jgi:hypothetical protein